MRCRRRCDSGGRRVGKGMGQCSLLTLSLHIPLPCPTMYSTPAWAHWLDRRSACWRDWTRPRFSTHSGSVNWWVRQDDVYNWSVCHDIAISRCDNIVVRIQCYDIVVLRGMWRYRRSRSYDLGPSRQGNYLLHIVLWARRWIDHWVCDAWPVQRQTYYRLLLPSQLQSITAPWPVPNYTAWWQRHMGVNNLPRVVTQRCTGRESNLWLLNHKSDALTTSLPSHPVVLIKSYTHL